MKESDVANILLVDDSPADQLSVSRALEDGGVQCNLTTVDNGMKAIQLLQGEGVYDDRTIYPFPDLILMDINMPIMNGKEALKIIRESESFKNIPVVILTTSNSSEDVKESYNIGANAYITKPVEHEDFVMTLVKLEIFWFNLVALP